MIGNTLSHYRLIEKIGEGGMGVMWKAVDTKLNCEVAPETKGTIRNPRPIRKFLIVFMGFLRE